MSQSAAAGQDPETNHTAGTRVQVIHWKASEAGALLNTCRNAGFEVDYMESDGAAIARKIRADLPVAVVIDLSRIPSHGREMAVWLRGQKSTHRIPIVFVDGDPEKVLRIREILPDASYATLSTLKASLKSAIRRSKSNLIKPPAMMERWRWKSAVQKLGIVAGSSVKVVHPPRDFPTLLGDLPERVDFIEDHRRRSRQRTSHLVVRREPGFFAPVAPSGTRDGETDENVAALAKGLNERTQSGFDLQSSDGSGPGPIQALRRGCAVECHAFCEKEGMIGEILPRDFYEGEAPAVARDLLGKVLVCGTTTNDLTAGIIVETEAYPGGDDLASHSAAGITSRTRVIFGPPGHAYVYLSYGMHACMNIVVRPEGTPGCVLVRALEPLCGQSIMSKRRKHARSDRDLTNGPGKLTQALGITLAEYGADLTRVSLTRKSLTVRSAVNPRPFRVDVTPRIGITKCITSRLRFLIRNNSFVSIG